jgi:uncharacterized protein YgbK (DUF1537 family)
MLLGVIADDFTGASDIANTLTKGFGDTGGLDTVQYLGVPPVPADPRTEAGVVALKTRSIDPQRAVRQSLAALNWLRQQGCRQIVFKYCSTFDSTAGGNIGPVAEALASELAADGVVFCPAFPAAGRSVYQGHVFVFDRLLNESGMEHHPVTPMKDADIRRVLQSQTGRRVGHIAWPTVAAGSDSIEAALRSGRGKADFFVADALTENDLLALARACRQAPLLTGGSGIALGLPANFISAGLARGRAPGIEPAAGRAVVLAGSCSKATRAQIGAHLEHNPGLLVDGVAAVEGRIGADDLVGYIAAQSSGIPIVYTSAEPQDVERLQKQYGAQAVSAALEGLMARTAAKLVAGGCRKLIVAGGETSGAVVSALGLQALRIGREIDPGVPLLQAEGAEPVTLALKSGNFGSSGFFEKAARMMEAGG